MSHHPDRDVPPGDREALLPAWSTFSVQRVREGRLQGREPDALVEEVPVALEFNGISHATMLATPTDLEDFARGFALTEGIVGRVADIRGIDIEPEEAGIVIRLEIATACEMRLRERRRIMAGRTGCGLCGVETLAQVRLDMPSLPQTYTLSLAAVRRAQREMRAAQVLHDATGASHAAAYATEEGAVACVREDVGRHNALDKLVGAIHGPRRPHLARDMPRAPGASVQAGFPEAGLPDASLPMRGFALVSSRASFEMVQKAVVAGFGALVAVSAPTAMAVRQARAAGLILLGFQRGDSATVYAGEDRIRA